MAGIFGRQGAGFFNFKPTAGVFGRQGAGVFNFKPIEGPDVGDMSEGDINNLALLGAMGGVQQAGLQRTNGPMGAIAQTLIPIFGAMIQAKALQAHADAQQASDIQDKQMNQLKMDLLKAQTIKAQREQGPKNLNELLAQRLMTGQPYDDVVQAMKASQKPPADTDYSLLRQANPNASPQELLDLQQQRKEGQAAAGAAATTTARLNAERGLKKDLSPNDIDDYVKMTSGIDSMGGLLDQLETPGGAPSRLSGAVTKLSGGMISNPFWRKYASFRNDVINKRFKSRFTGPEGEALAQELPDPMSYAADPQGFLKSVRVAFDHAQGLLKKTYEYDSDVFNIGPRTTLGVVSAIAPRGAKKGQNAAGGDKTKPTTVDSLIDEVYGGQ